MNTYLESKEIIIPRRNILKNENVYIEYKLLCRNYTIMEYTYQYFYAIQKKIRVNT